MLHHESYHLRKVIADVYIVFEEDEDDVCTDSLIKVFSKRIVAEKYAEYLAESRASYWSEKLGEDIKPEYTRYYVERWDVYEDFRPRPGGGGE